MTPNERVYYFKITIRVISKYSSLLGIAIIHTKISVAYRIRDLDMYLIVQTNQNGHMSPLPIAQPGPTVMRTVGPGPTHLRLVRIACDKHTSQIITLHIARSHTNPGVVKSFCYRND